MLGLYFGEVLVEFKEEKLVLTLNEHKQHIEICKDQLPLFVEYLTVNIEETSEERQIGFRIPINQLDAGARRNISVTIETNEEQVNVTLIDFSLTGMLVEGIQKLTLDTNSEIVATVSFMDESVSISAKLVRISGDHKFALYFPSSLVDGELEPVDELVRVFRQLEFAWLRNRVSK